MGWYRECMVRRATGRGKLVEPRYRSALDLKSACFCMMEELEQVQERDPRGGAIDFSSDLSFAMLLGLQNS